MYQNPPTEHSQRKAKKEKEKGIYEKYGIEVNVAVDVVVDVLGEPEILGGSEAVHWGQTEVIVAISSHCLFSFSLTFVFLLLSLSHFTLPRSRRVGFLRGFDSFFEHNILCNLAILLLFGILTL
jgi:hypothetical protein